MHESSPMNSMALLRFSILLTTVLYVSSLSAAAISHHEPDYITFADLCAIQFVLSTQMFICLCNGAVSTVVAATRRKRHFQEFHRLRIIHKHKSKNRDPEREGDFASF